MKKRTYTGRKCTDCNHPTINLPDSREVCEYCGRCQSCYEVLRGEGGSCGCLDDIHGGERDDDNGDIDPMMFEQEATMKSISKNWRLESDGTTIAMENQIVVTMPAPDGASRETVKANAALIAAAPDLADALDVIKSIADDAQNEGRHIPSDEVEAIIRYAAEALKRAGR